MILIVLENDMYVRNFVSSGALDRLLERADCQICPSELVNNLENALTARGFDPSKKVGPRFERNPVNIRITLEFNILSMQALTKKSKTFEIKTRKKLYRSTTRWSRLYPLLSPLMSWPGMFNRVRGFFSDRLKNNPSLETVIQTIEPTVTVFPVTGVESTGTELVKLSRRYGFKTIFLTNGWDNLSSKGVFMELPDVLGVWGPQSALHAVECQRMPADQPERIASLGCARYEDYFQQTVPSAPVFNFPYILFAGATTACDELSSLHMIENCLATLKLAGDCDPRLKLVYRPHPWREPRSKRCDDCFNPADFQHSILDPQVADHYLKNKKLKQESVSADHYPGLSYYTSLLQQALMVVSPMSSMTLEAALFDVPTLILAVDDGMHRIPSHLQAQYTHFEGGRNVPGWIYVDALDNLETQFVTLLKQIQKDNPDQRYFRPQLREAMRQYLTWSETKETYSDRLAKIV